TPQHHHIPNSLQRLNPEAATELLDDFRALEPPDPIPNSEVKRRIADGSVGSPHVRVGHRQAPKLKRPVRESWQGVLIMRDLTGEPRSFARGRPLWGGRHTTIRHMTHPRL